MVAGVNKARREDTLSTHRERVLRAMVHIQSNLGSELTLERLADVAHMSPFHFQRVFRECAGEGPAAFVRRLRLERAARDLRYSARTVGRIAADLGYGHRESFVRAFHARFGASPLRYRDRAIHPRRANGQPLSRAGEGSRIAKNAIGGPDRIRVDNFPAVHVAFIRRIGGDGAPFDQFPRLIEWGAERQQARPQDLVRLGVVHDDPAVTPESQRRFDVCICVAPNVRPEGDIGVQVVGGGEYAVGTLRGPHPRLPATRARISRECVTLLRRTLRAAPAIEVYLNDGVRVSRLVTDVLVPVETERRSTRWYFRRSRPA